MSSARSIPWLRLIAESTAIVASILIAFGIDAAWDRRQTNRQAASVLASLRSEFQAHSDTLARWARDTESHAHTLARGIAILSDPSASPGVATLDSLFFSLVYVGDWDPRGGALEALIASGNLDLIGDRRLQRELTSWSGMVDDVLDNQHLMQNFVLGVVIPVLAARSDAVSRIWPDPRKLWPGGEEGDEEASAAYEPLLRSSEVRGLMATKYEFVRTADFRRALARAEAIVELIDQNLDR